MGLPANPSLLAELAGLNSAQAGRLAIVVRNATLVCWHLDKALSQF